jgi:hypothetical protein
VAIAYSRSLNYICIYQGSAGCVLYLQLKLHRRGRSGTRPCAMPSSACSTLVLIVDANHHRQDSQAAETIPTIPTDAQHFATFLAHCRESFSELVEHWLTMSPVRFEDAPTALSVTILGCHAGGVAVLAREVTLRGTLSNPENAEQLHRIHTALQKLSTLPCGEAGSDTSEASLGQALEYCCSASASVQAEGEGGHYQQKIVVANLAKPLLQPACAGDAIVQALRRLQDVFTPVHWISAEPQPTANPSSHHMCSCPVAQLGLLNVRAQLIPNDLPSWLRVLRLELQSRRLVIPGVTLEFVGSNSSGGGGVSGGLTLTCDMLGMPQVGGHSALGSVHSLTMLQGPCVH